MSLFTRVSDTAFESDFARIERLPSGVVQVRYTDDVEITEGMSAAITRRVFELSPFERAVILVDRGPGYEVSFEAQQFIMQQRDLAAVAYLVRNPRLRPLAEHAAETYLHHVPTRVFGQKEQALGWMKSFLPPGPPG